MPRAIGFRIAIGAFALCCLMSTAARADDATLYRTLKASLDERDFAAADDVIARLGDSPIEPYARLARLRASLGTVNPGEVSRYLDTHAELPATDALRVAWLRELARREDWDRFLGLYSGETDVYVRCALVRAQIARGRKETATDTALNLWHVGYRQPQSCVPAFDFLQTQGELTPERITERIRLALAAGNPSLGRAYLDRLPATDRAAAFAWIAVYGAPAKALDLPPDTFREDTAATVILESALTALARRDPAAAHALWPKLRARFALEERAAVIERTIALQAVYENLPAGRRWLDELQPDYATETVHAWRARSALREADWQGVLDAIDRMDTAQRTESIWLYWRGRALAETGNTEAATELFANAARDFSYYGFLAADAADRSYYWGDAIDPADSVRQDTIGERLGARRAMLLHRADEPEWAQDEWRTLVLGLDRRDRLAAARLALAADWPWATLYASGTGGVRNASFLRFPTGFIDAVRASADRTEIPPPWLLALIRQESAFRRSSCSHAGACGLMQLMPGTARWMLKRLGESDEDVGGTLADPHRSIEAGSAYLAYLHGRFENFVLTFAAYNAGPGTVKRWLNTHEPPAATPRWVETLPFGETREYLKAVLFNQVIYHLRMTGRTDRLTAVFRPEDQPPGRKAVANR